MTVTGLSLQQFIILALAALQGCLGLFNIFLQSITLAHAQLLSLLQTTQLIAQLQQLLHAGEESILRIAAPALGLCQGLGLLIPLGL